MRPRWLAFIFFIALSACLGNPSGGESSASPSAGTTAPGPSSVPKQVGRSFCRSGSALANVYHPRRLLVLARCIDAIGVVRTVRREPDGDVHFDLALELPFRRLLNRGNFARQHG